LNVYFITEKTDIPAAPESENYFILTIASTLGSQRSHFFQSAKWRKSDDVEINNVSPFDVDHEKEIAAS
jgi:hypothetical protein